MDPVTEAAIIAGLIEMLKIIVGIIGKEKATQVITQVAVDDSAMMADAISRARGLE